MKKCSHCKQQKNESDFHKDGGSKDGLFYICKVCNCAKVREARLRNHEQYKIRQKERHAANREVDNAKSLAYREANIELVREKDRQRGRLRSKESIKECYKRRAEAVKLSAKRWAEQNPDKRKAIKKKWSNANRDAVNFLCAKRRATKKQATPAWTDEFIMKEAFHLAKLREKATGFKWHVDHIVPLQSSIVCGLHAHTNMQVIPATKNMSKSNVIWPDMP